MIGELYQLARREALDIDSVIDSLLRDLNEERKGQTE